jgi:hypothetical protein
VRSKFFSTLAVGLALSACAATAAAPNLLLAIHPRPAQAQRPIAQRDAPANQNQLSSEKNNGTDDKVDPEWKKQLEKEAKEDERFAATCNPLKSKVNSLLQSSSAGIRAFNEAFSAVKHLQNQWSGSCPDRIRLVSGFVEKTVPCYNATYLVRLSDGDYYSISPSSTQLFGPAQGWASKELVIGITLRQTSCVSSISPTMFILLFRFLLRRGETGMTAIAKNSSPIMLQF